MKELTTIKAEVVALLIHNGYKTEDGIHFDKDFKYSVTVTQSETFVDVNMSCVFVDSPCSTVLTNNVSLKASQADEYDMYDEYGTPEAIVVRMMDDMYKKAFFLEAINDNKQLCIYEKPSIQHVITTDVPF